MDFSKLKNRAMAVEMCYLVNSKWRCLQTACISPLRNLTNRGIEWTYSPAFRRDEIERIGVRVDVDVTCQMLDYILTAPQYDGLFKLEDGIFSCAVDAPTDAMVSAFRSYINLREFPVTAASYDYLLDNGIDKDVAFIVASSLTSCVKWATIFDGHIATNSFPESSKGKLACLKAWREQRPSGEPYNEVWEYDTIANYITSTPCPERVNSPITKPEDILLQAVMFR